MQRSKPRAVWPAIEEWRLAQTAQGLAARTVTERCRVAQQLADGTGDPLTVSTRQVRAWVAVQDVSQSTRCTYDRYLRAFFRFLVEDDLRQDDPLAKAKRVRDPRREARPVKDEHLELLLASRMHHRTRVMILLCAFQGLRVHEVAKIRGEDVDLTAGLLFVEGKGGVTASLPLHELVAAEAQRMPRRGWWFPAYEAQGRAGAHVHGNTVSTVISQAMRRCGIVGGTAHKLRHWYGTSLVAGGTNLRATQELLRHASLQTTQQYVRVQAQDMTEGIARLGADLQVPRLRRRPGRGAA